MRRLQGQAVALSSLAVAVILITAWASPAHGGIVPLGPLGPHDDNRSAPLGESATATMMRSSLRTQARPQPAARAQDLDANRLEAAAKLEPKFLGTGYDISVGTPDPFDQGGSNLDPGLNVGAVVLEHSNAVSDTVLQCNQNSETQILDKWEEVQKYYSKSVGGTGIDVTIPLKIDSVGYDKFTISGSLDLTKFSFMQVAFSSSKSKQTWDTEFKEEKKVSVQANAMCTVQQSGLPSGDYKISQGFSKAVANTPSYYSYSWAKRFVMSWGTHVITTADYGGMYAMRLDYSSEKFDSLHLDKSTVQYPANKILFWTITPEHTETTLTETEKHVYDEKTNVSTKTLGSSKINNGWDTWVADVQENAQPIRMSKLLALSELVISDYFPTDTTLEEKRAVIGIAISCAAAGWPGKDQGSNCQDEHTPTCTKPCQNGGVCIKDEVCKCPQQWTGGQCQTPVCDPPCGKHGSCSAPGKCSCEKHWSGPTCDKRVCKEKDCSSGDACCNGGGCWEQSGMSYCNPGSTGCYCGS